MRATLVVPPPAERISVSQWQSLRAWLLENDPDAVRILDWSVTGCALPKSPELMAAAIIWVILCAGRSAQAARTIETKVWAAIDAGLPAVSAFGYRAKAAAIGRAWRERERDFAALLSIGNSDTEALLAWCKAIPFIGDDTQFQLAKNFGADVPKPDIWLCRLSGIPDLPRYPVAQRYAACRSLCAHLAQATADRLAAVDSLLWLACNKGAVCVDSQAGEVRFTYSLRGRSIFA